MRLRIIPVLICAFLITSYAASRPIDTDSVLSSLQSYSPARRAELLNKTAATMYRDSPREALILCRKAASLSKQTGNAAEEARAYYLQGNASLQLGAHKNALDFFTRSMKMEKALNRLNRESDCLSQLGNTYFQMDMYTLALDHHQKALRAREALKDSNGIFGSLNNLGIVLDEIGQYDQAREMYLRAMDLVSRQHDSLGFADVLNNLGVLYHNSGNMEMARQYYTHSLRVSENMRDLFGVSVQYGNIADLDIEAGRFIEAKSNLEKAFSIQKAGADSIGLVASMIKFGIISREEGVFGASEKYFKDAIALAARTNSRAYLRDAFEELALLYKKQKLYEKAFDASRKYIDVRDALEKEKNDLAAFSTYENIDVLRLREENEQLRQKSSQQSMLYFAIVFILALFAAFLFLRFREKKMLSKTLFEKNRLVEETNAELTRKNVEISGQQQQMTELLQELQTGKTRYQRLLESSPMGILLLAPDGRILELNKALLDILGSPSVEATKKINCFEFPNLIEAGIAHDLLDAIDRRALLHNERPYRTKWGKEIMMSYSIAPVMDEEGGLSGVLAVIDDVTLRRQAERAVLRSEQQFRAVWESSADGMRITDEQGIILNVNPALCELFRMKPEELIGRRFTDMHSYENEDRISEMLEKYRLRFMNRQVSASLHAPVYRADGTVFHAELSNSFIELPSGEVQLLSLFRDISSVVENEKRLREYSEEQLRLNKSKDKFFSIVAHDLKSPFHGLLGLSSILRDDYETLAEEERAELIVKLDDISHSIYDLVENLLEWSRIQRGAIPFEPRPVRLAESVTEVFGLLRHLALKKNVEIQNAISSELTVTADPKMLRSVFTNLIANAVKFSFPGGVVLVGAKETGTNVEVFVKDSGTGMSASEVEKLFKPEAVLSKPGTANERGTGLGLLIVKEMIDRHGGSITVESEPGTGSTFTFSLPQYPGTEQP